jgi:hypothetical protein
MQTALVGLFVLMEPRAWAQEPSQPDAAPAKAERLAEAKSILEAARKAAFMIPNKQALEKALALNGIAAAQAGAGDIGGAVVTLSAMVAPGDLCGALGQPSPPTANSGGRA